MTKALIELTGDGLLETIKTTAYGTALQEMMLCGLQGDYPCAEVEAMAVPQANSYCFKIKIDDYAVNFFLSFFPEPTIFCTVQYGEDFIGKSIPCINITSESRAMDFMPPLMEDILDVIHGDTNVTDLSDKCRIALKSREDDPDHDLVKDEFITWLVSWGSEPTHSRKEEDAKSYTILEAQEILKDFIIRNQKQGWLTNY